MISDGILLYVYISMGGHIIPEAEKVNTVVMEAFVRPVSVLYTFFPFTC